MKQIIIPGLLILIISVQAGAQTTSGTLGSDQKKPLQNVVLYRTDAPDADGDGIPNGKDKDYNRQGKNYGKRWADFSNCIDSDGDGVSDKNLFRRNQNNGNQWRKGNNGGINQNPKYNGKAKNCFGPGSVNCAGAGTHRGGR